jgi:hypothetical protein
MKVVDTPFGQRAHRPEAGRHGGINAVLDRGRAEASSSDQPSDLVIPRALATTG